MLGTLGKGYVRSFRPGVGVYFFVNSEFTLDEQLPGWSTWMEYRGRLDGATPHPHPTDVLRTPAPPPQVIGTTAV